MSAASSPMLQSHTDAETDGVVWGASNPDRVLALRRSHNLDLHGGRSQGSEFLCHALTNACKHGGAARKDNVAVEILTNVNIALHDGLESRVMDTACLLANEAWLEKHLHSTRAAEPTWNEVKSSQTVRTARTCPACSGM